MNPRTYTSSYDSSKPTAVPASNAPRAAVSLFQTVKRQIVAKCQVMR